MRTGRIAAALLAVALVPAVACGSDDPPAPGGSPGSPSPGATAVGPRPASPAELAIERPANGARVDTSGATVRISLRGAELTDATTQDITPDEGHLHVVVDDQLVSMTSGLEQTLPDLEPGRHVLRVEFVAADHLPFDPRVVTQAVFEAA